MSGFPGNPFGFGFVYFNNAKNTSDPNGSNDYLEFSNSESPGRHFSPTNSSSPNQFRQHNFRGNRNNKMYSRNRYNSSESNSNYTNSSNYSNQSYSSSKYGLDTDKKQYYHPSMVEDPWIQLEQFQDSLKQENSKKCATDTIDSTAEEKDFEDNIDPVQEND